MEAPRRVGEVLFLRDKLGPTFGHTVASIVGLLLVEKVVIDFVLPPWVPVVEAIFAHLGTLRANLVFGMLANFLGFWVFGTIFAIPAILDMKTWKIQEKRRLDLRQLKEALPLIVFNSMSGSIAASLAFHLFMPENAYDMRALPSTRELACHAVIWLVVQEVSFFYAHRYIHTNKRLYQAIHKIHHSWTSPVSITAIYCHPLEHLLVNVLTLILGPLLCGSHAAAVSVFLILALVHTTGVHSGYWLGDDHGMHDEHHRAFDANYGVVGIMDSLYGTYRLPSGAPGASGPRSRKLAE